MIIYVLSKDNKFGGKLDGGKFLNDAPLYDGNYYLYRQEWEQGLNDQYKMNHEAYIKTVDQKWISKHSKYYNRPVLDNVKPLNDFETQYNKFIDDNILSL